MAQSTFCLSWESHRTNICNGLSSLQQNGEFVDMTLAADGHHVKVHQMIMALSSPFIKDLIRSASCPHPVIFLNKLSYTTLSSILEYIYTGEVVVSVENLSELIQAARELHIKGLEDMNFQTSVGKQTTHEDSMMEADDNMEDVDDEICYFEVSRMDTPSRKLNYTMLDDGIPEDSNSLGDTVEDSKKEIEEIVVIDQSEEQKPRIISCTKSPIVPSIPNVQDKSSNMIQYTVSNQGSLQMILNRYVYYLKHCNRNNSRQWRCVDYLNSAKCPAVVFTRDDVVTQRISAHTHPMHDKRILKKVRAGAVFSAIHEAEREGNDIKSKTKETANAHTVTVE